MRKVVPMLTGIVAIVTILVWLSSCANKIEYAETLRIGDFATTMITTLGPGEKGDVKALEINIPGTIVKSSTRLKLMGDLDFRGLPGDVLVFLYSDDAWNEIGRRLQ